jgi:hypothetical protein
MGLSPVRGLEKLAISAGTAGASLFRQITLYDKCHDVAKLLSIGQQPTGVVVR